MIRCRVNMEKQSCGGVGIRVFWNIVKALAAGGHAVMLGSMFAGTDEAPQLKLKFSKVNKFKTYRGMGIHIAAMKRRRI